MVNVCCLTVSCEMHGMNRENNLYHGLFGVHGGMNNHDNHCNSRNGNWMAHC